MDIERYKERFKKEYLFSIVELSDEEIEEVPKDDKTQEYEYLHSRGYFLKENKYYKRIEVDVSDVSDEEISLFSQMKIIELLKTINQDISDIKRENKKKGIKLERLMTVLFILIVVTWFF